MIGSEAYSRLLIVFTRVPLHEDPYGRKVLIKFNGILKSGILGVEYVAANKTDTADESERSRKRKEILHHVMKIMESHHGEILIKDTFKPRAMTVFKNLIDKLDENISYEGLHNSMVVNMSVFKEFLDPSEMKTEINKQNKNLEEQRARQRESSKWCNIS